eukprot:15386085-Alexandrium_andersonii.AAC.1
MGSRLGAVVSRVEVHDPANTLLLHTLLQTLLRCGRSTSTGPQPPRKRRRWQGCRSPATPQWRP